MAAESGTFGMRKNAVANVDISEMDTFFITWNLCLCSWLGWEKREEWSGEIKVTIHEEVIFNPVITLPSPKLEYKFWVCSFAI